jgi:hypothetical protein
VLDIADELQTLVDAQATVVKTRFRHAWKLKKSAEPGKWPVDV